MSNPIDPTNEEPREGALPSDATAPVPPQEPAAPQAPADVPAPPAPPAPPVDAQPTAAYPAEPLGVPGFLPSEPAPQAPQSYPAAPQQGYAQPGYPQQQGYAQPGYPQGYAGYGAPAPVGPDTRPKTLAVIALVLAVLGVIGAALGFIPFLGLIAIAVGGLLLSAAFVLSIVALVMKTQGGKGLSITALVLSIVGGIVLSISGLIGALFTAGTIIDEAGKNTPSASASASAEPSEDPTTEPTDEASEDPEGESGLTANEQAYVDEVRAEFLPVFKEILGSSVDDDAIMQQIEIAYADDALVLMGKQILPSAGNPALRKIAVDSAIEASQGLLNEDTAGRMIDTIINAAEKYLK